MPSEDRELFAMALAVGVKVYRGEALPYLAALRVLRELGATPIEAVEAIALGCTRGMFAVDARGLSATAP